MLSTWWTPLRGKYDDGGFSCGNTDRPALQRLLEGCAGRLKRPQTEQQYYPELTGIRSLTERYCRQFRALRSPRDPAPSALWPRWGFGGAARRRHQPNGGSQCQSLQSNEQLHHPQRLFRLQILRNRPLTILRLRRPSRARSNLASSPCFNRPRGQRLPR